MRSMKEMFKSRFILNFFRILTIVILIMVLGNLAIVLYTINGYRDSVGQDNLSYLSSISQRITRDFNESTERMARTMLENDNYNRYIRLSSDTEGKNLLYLDLKATLLKMLYGYEDFYSDIAMYYIDTKELVSGMKGFFQLSRDANQDFRVLYGTEEIPEYSNGLTISGSNEEDGLSARIIYKISDRTAMVFLINPTYFDTLFYRDFENSSQSVGILVSNGNGTILYSAGELPEHENQWPEISSEPEGTFTQFESSDGTSWLTAALSIRQPELQFLLFQKKVLLDQLNQYSRLLGLFTALTAFCVLAAFTAAFFYSRKMYRPIRNIVEDIAEPPKKVQKVLDEFGVINQYMETSRIRMSELEGIVASNRLILKERFIKYLANTPEPDMANISEYLKVMKTTLPFPYFTGITCTLSSEITSSISYTDLNLLQMQLIRQAEGNCEPDSAVLFGGADSDFVIHFVLNTASPEAGERAMDALYALAGRYFSDNGSVPFFLCAGSQTEGLLSLYPSFLAADQNSARHFFLPEEKKQWFCASDFADILGEAPLRAYLHLLNQSGTDSADVNRVLENARSVFSRGLYDLDSSRNAAALTAQYLQRILSEQNLQPDAARLKLLLQPEQYFWNVFRYLDFARETFQISAEAPARKVPLEQKINDYINENLACDLSLDILADAFQLHPKYISKLYKEKTGSNITNYITEKRIARAVTLLTTTDMTIENIAAESGFSSSGYFIKKFREIMGMTPSAFKKEQAEHTQES